MLANLDFVKITKYTRWCWRRVFSGLKILVDYLFTLAVSALTIR